MTSITRAPTVHPPASAMPVRSPHLLLFVLLIGGCSLLLSDGQKRDLNDARDRWERLGWDDYRFTFNWQCFCIYDYVRPVEITVRGGEVRAAVYVDSSRAVPDEDLDRYLTIEGLFDLIDEARDRDAHRIDAAYDPELGYPTDVWIDYDEHVADEERGFAVEEVRQLP